MYERHTAEVICDVATKTLDVLYPSWKVTIIGISTGREKKVTGHISGAVQTSQSLIVGRFISINNADVEFLNTFFFEASVHNEAIYIYMDYRDGVHT